MVHTYNPAHAPTAGFSPAQGQYQPLIEMVERLQTQAPSTILGNTYVYDLVDQQTLYSSYSIATLLGYTNQAIHDLGPTGLASLIHPDDLEAVSAHFQRFSTLNPNEVISVDYRMRRADGRWCWLRSQETPLVTAIDGCPLQILGIVQELNQLIVPELEDLAYWISPMLPVLVSDLDMAVIYN